MPAMPRPQGKATKIAFKILGKPANFIFKPTAEQKRINRKLVFEQTARVR